MRRVVFFILLVIAVLTGTGIYLYFKGKEPTDVLVLYGNIDVRQVDLGFRVNGRVTEMPFQEGDVVKQGDLVAVLDTQPYIDLLEQAKANVLSSEIALQNADLVLQRRNGLVGTGGVSQEDQENAQSSRDTIAANLAANKAALGVALTNLNDTRCYSPSSGVILTRIREPGTVVKASDPVTTLSLTSPVWVRAFVTEPHLGQVYPGMPAEVYTDTANGKVYTGHVGFISPVAEFTPKSVETTQLRTDLVYRLRIIADNPDQGLRQGMPVTVKLRLKPVHDDG